MSRTTWQMSKKHRKARWNANYARTQLNTFAKYRHKSQIHEGIDNKTAKVHLSLTTFSFIYHSRTSSVRKLTFFSSFQVDQFWTSVNVWEWDLSVDWLTVNIVANQTVANPNLKIGKGGGRKIGRAQPPQSSPQSKKYAEIMHFRAKISLGYKSIICHWPLCSFNSCTRGRLKQTALCYLGPWYTVSGKKPTLFPE